MLQALVSLFVIIDPVGNILVFHLYSRHFGLSERLLAAVIAVGASFTMLLAFALGGQGALDSRAFRTRASGWLPACC